MHSECTFFFTSWFWRYPKGYCPAQNIVVLPLVVMESGKTADLLCCSSKLIVNMGGCGSRVEPASCYLKAAGLIPLVCISKCPWERHWTPTKLPTLNSSAHSLQSNFFIFPSGVIKSPRQIKWVSISNTLCYNTFLNLSCPSTLHGVPLLVWVHHNHICNTIKMRFLDM